MQDPHDQYPDQWQACEPGQVRPLRLSSGTVLGFARKEMATDKDGDKPRAAADTEKRGA